jgi:ABC-type lipoprotein release transport system permease subunit
MTNQLFGLDPWDPVMLTFAIVLIGVTALLASLITAWRAARVDSMVSLRTE